MKDKITYIRKYELNGEVNIAIPDDYTIFHNENNNISYKFPDNINYWINPEGDIFYMSKIDKLEGKLEDELRKIRMAYVGMGGTCQGIGLYNRMVGNTRQLMSENEITLFDNRFFMISILIEKNAACYVMTQMCKYERRELVRARIKYMIDTIKII